MGTGLGWGAWKACCATEVERQALSPKVSWQVEARLEHVLMRLWCGV